jgi:hypothetical protein
VRRLLTWAVVSLGIAALARKLKQRNAASEKAAADEVATPAEAAPESDPAAELRQKLAEARADEEAVEPPATEPATVEERRAQVHDAGRAALDEMRDVES